LDPPITPDIFTVQLCSPNSGDIHFTAQSNSNSKVVGLSRDAYGNVMLSPGYDNKNASIRKQKHQNRHFLVET
jgi:hypothetical protein